jgi:hypothetical protein
MKREKLIRRYEHNYFTGWVVATKREGRRYPAVYFSDKPDGRRAALTRAKEYRDRFVTMLPKAHKIKRSYRTNTTGEVGVARVKERTRAGRPFVRYVATWPTDAGGVCRRVKASFSVALYGEAGAKRRAIRARRAGVAEFLATTQRKWV